jgi:very-short-patch-repair endonuclease
MKFALEHEHMIRRMYKDGGSSYEIAEALGTYSTKILRALKYLKIEARDYGEAQKVALKKGRSKTPIEKGGHLSEAHKVAVSEGRAKAWSEISDEERARLSDISKAQWKAMSDEQKHTLRSLAASAVREAAVEGSKTEKHLRKSLTEAGWSVRFHDKNLIPSQALEIDLFVSELKTAIEIDGPSHFLPIWGEEKLQRHQKADDKKAGLLMAGGYVLIRVKQMTKTLSQHKLRMVSKRVLEELTKVHQKFPEPKDRLIEIEV